MDMLIKDPDTARRHAYFEKVENKDHWKGPIDAVIRSEDYVDCADAVDFFTATSLDIEWEAGGSMGVSSVGYWSGPAGGS